MSQIFSRSRTLVIRSFCFSRILQARPLHHIDAAPNPTLIPLNLAGLRCGLARICWLRLAYAIFLCIPIFLASCNNDKIAVYRIPKENVTVAMESGELAAPGPEHSAQWVKPDGWSEQPVSEMRLGSFKVNGPDGTSADVSVVAFPGEAGGLVSNINRWRGQLELPPLEEKQLPETIQQTEIQGAPAFFVDLQTAENSSKPSRILGAVLQRPSHTWFVKMTGSPALLASQRQKFLDFVNSFRFNDSDQSGAAPSPPRQRSTNDK